MLIQASYKNRAVIPAKSLALRSRKVNCREYRHQENCLLKFLLQIRKELKVPSLKNLHLL